MTEENGLHLLMHPQAPQAALHKALGKPLRASLWTSKESVRMRIITAPFPLLSSAWDFGGAGGGDACFVPWIT